jgi:DNA-binding transcriptional ArsR family regulator
MVFAANLKGDLSETPDLWDPVIVPKLPEACRIAEGEGAAACSWLDDYIAFSKTWSPRGFDGFHESCGLWLLSTIAARRIGIHMGKMRFTSLYIALTARTSSFSKSTTAGIAISTLQRAGLDYLLMADYATPQKFLMEMEAVLPEDFTGMDEERKARILSKLVFSGQRGWYFEEFGQGIAAMMRRDGYMTDFRGLLRRFDDTPDQYESGTIGRGNNRVERPYLALLVSMTPADLAPFAQRGSSLWGDGFLARFALITPPLGARRRGRFPKGERVIPPELFLPLQVWHTRLGIPQVDLIEEKATKTTGSLRVKVQSLDSQVLSYAEDVYEAFYAYDEGLNEVCSRMAIEDLDGNYARFSEKALRLAAIFASLGISEKIEMRHWARAQAITERWRAGLHALHQVLNNPNPSMLMETEERILRVIRRLKGASVREIRQQTRLPAREINSILDGLMEAELVRKEPVGRTTRFFLSEDGEI